MLERIGSSAADGDVSAARGVLHGAMAGAHMKNLVRSASSNVIDR
jgi:hypothetical protein